MFNQSLQQLKGLCKRFSTRARQPEPPRCSVVSRKDRFGSVHTCGKEATSNVSSYLLCDQASCVETGEEDSLGSTPGLSAGLLCYRRSARLLGYLRVPSAERYKPRQLL